MQKPEIAVVLSTEATEEHPEIIVNDDGVLVVRQIDL